MTRKMKGSNKSSTDLVLRSNGIDSGRMLEAKGSYETS